MEKVIIIHSEGRGFKELLTEIVQEAVREQIGGLIQTLPPPKDILSRKEAAKLLGISLPTLHDYTKTLHIKGYRIGTQLRYRYGDLIKALKPIGRG